MKKLCLLLSTFLVFVMLAGISNSNVYAQSNPEVKIGLYYKSTAQSQIDISSDKGVSFNSYDSTGNNYIEVFKSEPAQIITVKKDSSFHIGIGDNYNTYDEAASLVKDYNQKGIEAYPAYTDSGWQIWSGFYSTKADADTSTGDIKSKLGSPTYKVIEPANTRISGADKKGQALFMYASEKNLLRGKSLSTDNPNPIKIGNALYRGQVEFYRKSDSDMTIINVLPLEEYLYGVVPNEMEASSNAEALKAQAIASRTYTYKYINKHSANGFNLCTTTDCHVYKGYSTENPATNKAVDDTRNMVVNYNGTLAETLYFSSSGGRTESAVNVWGSDVPYLKSVEDKYESGKSYMYNWNVKYTASELTEKLKSRNIGAVTGIEITKYSDAGRPIELLVKGTLKPEGLVITNDKCRTFLGLYSQWYTISTNADINISKDNQTKTTQLSQVKVVTASGQKTYSNPDQKVTIVKADGTKTTVSSTPTEYYFTGKGWGHAVGMSQEGAKGMANAGFKYDDILKHYFTGTEIEMKK